MSPGGFTLPAVELARTVLAGAINILPAPDSSAAELLPASDLHPHLRRTHLSLQALAVSEDRATLPKCCNSGCVRGGALAKPGLYCPQPGSP